MPTYLVNCNHLYFNQTLNTFEVGLLLGDSQLQFGDRFEANSSQVSDVLKTGAVKAV